MLYNIGILNIGVSKMTNCPACYAERNVEAVNAIRTDWENGKDIAKQKVECMDCHSQWTDIYELTNHKYLIKPQGSGETAILKTKQIINKTK